MKKRLLAIVLSLVFVLGVFVVPASASFISDDWAIELLETADKAGLIPASLAALDLKQDITRAEFAAVAVKLYENLSGKQATPASPNPFTDTSDPEVLKAYNVEITAGLGDGLFAPNDPLTREMAATMLTRAIKAACIEGWSLGTDGSFTLDFVPPAAFADDAGINSWARSSVYFMASRGIITGRPGNAFDPQGNTQRQEAIAISVRSVGKLDENRLTFTTNDTPNNTPDPNPIDFTGAGPELKENYTAAEIALLRAGCEGLIQDFPQGGREIPIAELDALLGAYAIGSGAGPVSYYKGMYGAFSLISGKWVVAPDGGTIRLERGWLPMPPYEYYTYRYETLWVASMHDSMATGTLECNLNIEDAVSYNYYSWDKGSTRGVHTRYLKWLGDYDYDDDYDYDNDYDYEDPIMPVIILYPDAVINGHECIVYSFYYEFAHGYQIEWFSKSEGRLILHQWFSPEKDYVQASYLFEETFVSYDADLFDPGKQGVTTWDVYTYDD